VEYKGGMPPKGVDPSPLYLRELSSVDMNIVYYM